MNFKVGDIITGKRSSYSWLKHYYAQIIKVTDTGKYLLKMIKNLDGDDQWNGSIFWEAEHFELVNPGTMFSVGDIIRGTPESDSIYSVTNSNMKKAVVTEIKENRLISIRVLEHTYKEFIEDKFTIDSSYFTFFEADDFTSKADSKEVSQKIQIKDRVKLISENPENGFGAVETGDIGIVSFISSVANEKGYPITIDFPTQHGWTGYADELLVVKEDNVKENCDKKVNDHAGFKVGDIIKKVEKVGKLFTFFEVIDLLPNGKMRTKIIGNCERDSSIGKEYTMFCNSMTYIPVIETEFHESFSVGDVVCPANIVTKDGSVYSSQHKLGIIVDKYTYDNTFAIYILESNNPSDIFLNKVIYGVTAKNIRYVRKETNKENKLRLENKEEPIMPFNPFDKEIVKYEEPKKAQVSGPQNSIEKIKKSEGSSIMNINAKTFGLGNIGVDKSGNFKLSMLGLAIMNSQGDWVVYDAEESVMVNVCDMVVETKDMVFKLPVQNVEVGDLIIHQGLPVYVVAKGKSNRITVLNPLSDKEETIVPQKNIVGFGFFVKVVSMLSMLGFNTAAAGDNPMAMMMPMMLLGGDGFGGKDGEFGMMEMLMFSQLAGGQAKGANPMANMMPLMMLMGNKNSEGNNMMEMLLMSQMFSGNSGFNLGGAFGTQIAAPTETVKSLSQKTSKKGKVKVKAADSAEDSIE